MIARRAVEIGMAMFTSLFGVVTMIGATEYGVKWTNAGPEPGLFPFAIGCIIMLASIGNLLLAMFGAQAAALRETFITREQFRLVAGFALPAIGFVIASLVLGIYVATALYMFGTMVFQNGYRLLPAGVIALGLPLFFYGLIERIFQVSLLKGPLEAMLGL